MRIVLQKWMKRESSKARNLDSEKEAIRGWKEIEMCKKGDISKVGKAGSICKHAYLKASPFLSKETSLYTL